MSAVARRPDYRTDTAIALRRRVHDDLRRENALVADARRAREELFWNAVISDFERDLGGLCNG